MENNLKKEMEDDLKKTEDDLKKNGRRPQAQFKNQPLLAVT